ncbi:MAG: hypothetical protein MSD82_01830 [Prevotella sp.]|nr:hypothetical protein [Prevotella sp.]
MGQMIHNVLSVFHQQAQNSTTRADRGINDIPIFFIYHNTDYIKNIIQSVFINIAVRGGHTADTA